MRPARLDLTIRSAMRAPSPRETPAQASPPSPPPQRRFSFVRRLLSPLLSPVANYARRYLQASVEHELRETRNHLHAVSADLHALSAHLGDLEHRLDLLLSQNARLGAALGQLDARVERDGVALARLPGLFGPRFDELEIKARPLIHYDSESTAIRMRDGYILAPTALPTFVTMLANATSRGLEPGTGDALRRLVQPGMVVADVGANIGLLTLLMAWAAGPSGKVIAFEPEATPRANLEKMKHLNGLSWVEVRDQAVGEKPGRLTFHVSDIIGHSSLYALPEAEEARTVEVEVVRLDDVAPAKRMDVVKIDVEGAELDVLAGMKGLIAKNPDLAIVAEFGPEHLKRVGQTPAQWFKAFADAGFEAYLIDEATSAAEPTNAKAAAKLVSANIAFVRAGGDAERRLLSR
ncbi:FkbM family methyltransferase [Caulobacter sp. RL271]|uniref:FkbM family methyltransferase n=2 Tax=Caulobacter TaxID=75 RepID=A0ABY4ZXB2_9CAUL|nr:FkbM family methyltransferase [Caulobacter segnis]USQ97426.1 FkbM family methyltransferase [Caulobacter segnis]